MISLLNILILSGCSQGWSVANLELTPQDTVTNTVFIEVMGTDSVLHYYHGRVYETSNWCWVHHQYEMSGKPDTARSYRTAILDDNAIVSINLKWLAQGCVLVAVLVYGYWQIENRIKSLENKVANANEQIGDLLNKHIVEERTQRQELAEKVAFYEKELNLNPFSWGKRKKK